ncbi:PRC-barrel domain-containing protein, partial [Clostridium sp. ZBS12]
MIRTKDFYLKKIYNLEGKKIGTIKDIYINF